MSDTGDNGPETHAVIDIGTNSIHLLVARLDDDGGFDVVAQEKEPVRLGSGAGDLDLLTDDAIDRGIGALGRFVQMAQIWNADVTAVATSAVREAKNRREFVQRARFEAGVDVDVITGVEEARLIYLGVLQALQVIDRDVMLVDIGGGSTEILVGHNGTVTAARSLKVGHIRLTDRFFPDGKVTSAAVDDCRKFIRSFLSPVVHELKGLPREIAVGCSGTIEAIAGLIEHAEGRTPRTLNNVEFTRAQLNRVTKQVLAAKTTERRRELSGLDPRRADVMPGGVLLLQQIFEQLQIQSLTVSEYALREGVFLDRFRQRIGPAAFHHLSDIRLDGVLRMADLFQEDREHVTHATDLALRLFDETKEVHGRGHRWRDLLEAAGLLHNVGLFISHAAHHKHSYYVIRNSDQLVGFTDREIELVAQIARYHRKSAPKKTHPEFAELGRKDQNAVRLLAGLLRLGIALDRGRTTAVHDVRCRITKDTCEIGLTVTGDVELERYSADQRKDLAEEALGRSIEIEIDERAASPEPAHPSYFPDP